MQLYHSETNTAEILLFRSTWQLSGKDNSLWSNGFSPDGSWLLLMQPDVKPDDQVTQYIRPVDGSDRELRRFSYGAGLTQWSGPTHLTATNFPVQNGITDDVFIVTFPEGNARQRWHNEYYRLYPDGWSPDGKKLLIAGYLITPTDPALTATPDYMRSDVMALFIANVLP